MSEQACGFAVELDLSKLSRQQFPGKFCGWCWWLWSVGMSSFLISAGLRGQERAGEQLHVIGRNNRRQATASRLLCNVTFGHQLTCKAF